jgi:hypothetical protein
MRTTVEIPDEMRKKLVEEAASRNLRGFSPLIVEALRLYFSRHSGNREKRIKNLKGSLSAEQLELERARLKQVRENWRK